VGNKFVVPLNRDQEMTVVLHTDTITLTVAFIHFRMICHRSSNHYPGNLLTMHLYIPDDLDHTEMNRDITTIAISRLAIYQMDQP
jgi:hypothetical protein